MQYQIENLTINTRKATGQDYQFCYRLAKRNMIELVKKHWGNWLPKVFREEFITQNITIITYKQRRIAYYKIQIEKDHIFIYDMQVSGKYQGKGLGTFMINQIEKLAINKKKNKIQLGVFPDNLAKKLYEKLGFITIKDKGHSLVMEKIII